jgi:PAS domain S-box-containing protein
MADTLENEIKEMLQQNAEDHLKIRKSATDGMLPETDMVKLIHELEVHQIELEMQNAELLHYISESKRAKLIAIENEELIIAKKKAEECEERYRALFEQASDGIFYLSTDGTVLKVNESFGRMHGYSVEEMEGMQLQDLDTPGSKLMAQERMPRVLAGENLEFEVEHYHRNGHVFPLAVSTGLVTIGGQHLIQAFHRDITARTLVEEENLKMKESLQVLNQHMIDIREDERGKISREIHDQLGQSLTALKIDLTWLRDKTGNGPEAVTKLDGMIEMITGTISDVQRISSELRPAILDDIGLASALEWYCEEFADRTGLKMNMEFEKVQSENMSKNLALYRVLQESLTNIARHADAEQVTVKLFRTDEKLVLIIQDDGIGISPDKISSLKSLGLFGMFERAKNQGGHMEIVSPGQGGVHICVTIPIK